MTSTAEVLAKYALRGGKIAVAEVDLIDGRPHVFSGSGTPHAWPHGGHHGQVALLFEAALLTEFEKAWVRAHAAEVVDQACVDKLIAMGATAANAPPPERHLDG